MQEAVEWYCNEFDIDKEDVYAYEVDMKKQYMEYPISEIPSHRNRRATCNGDGGPSIDITLKKALKYLLRLHKYKEPFILCVSP